MRSNEIIVFFLDITALYKRTKTIKSTAGITSHLPLSSDIFLGLQVILYP